MKIDMPLLNFFNEEVNGKEFKIDVTKEDIENGIRCSTSCCPIALAINRVLGLKSEWRYITVSEEGEPATGDEIVIIQFDMYGIQECSNEQEITDFILKFDTEEYVQPFSFTLEW